MQNDVGLLYRSQDIPAAHLVLIGNGRRKVPALLTGERRLVNAFGDIGAVFLADDLQGALNAVINVFDQSGSQFDRKRGTCGNHPVAASDASRFLIDLNGGTVAVHFNDLADQTRVAHAHHVEHIGFPHALRDHQRPGNLQNLSLNHMLSPISSFSFPFSGHESLNRISAPTARTTAFRIFAIP
ncbi:unknown [Clostridium sp. CAG:448]|nr:unknown [Clostridium sp. CAG:448]